MNGILEQFSVIQLFGIWFASGFILAVALNVCAWWGGEDVDLRDVAFCILAGIFGPVSWLVCLFTLIGDDDTPVIFKGRGR
jgi:hypothetical protein